MTKHKSIAVDGPSGAGKSTLAKLLARRLGFLYVDTGAIYRTVGLRAYRAGVDPEDEAAVTALLDGLDIELKYGADGLQHMYLDGEDVTNVKGRHLKKVRERMQMIFQDPYSSINPRLTISTTIREPLLLSKRFSRKELDYEVDKIMDKAGIEMRLRNAYPHELDGGRRQRVGIARALALEPEFIVCDEPVSALDVSVRAQVLNLIQDLQKTKKLTYLFISHDLSVVEFISDRVCVMFLGMVCEIGGTHELYAHPLHPYTHFLLNAIPKADPRLRSDEKELLTGEIPSPVNPPSGCRFHTRCPYAKDICSQMVPEGKMVGERQVFCHFPLMERK